MTSYHVQFILPVDNPGSKVSMTRSKGHMTFEVPINHPEAHKMGFQDLVAAAELSGLLTVSPTHNTAACTPKKRNSRKVNCEEPTSQG